MKVAVTWQMCGFVEVDKPTMEECLKELEENSDDYPLPANGEYVDGSFEPSSWDVEEQEAMCGMEDQGGKVMIIPEYRTLCDLTDEEIRLILTDIFKPEKITCIQRYKREQRVVANIYMKWDCGDGEETVIKDSVALRDPFGSGSPISADFFIDGEDIRRFRQFCLARGVCQYLKDNPYIQNIATEVR